VAVEEVNRIVVVQGVDTSGVEKEVAFVVEALVAAFASGAFVEVALNNAEALVKIVVEAEKVPAAVSIVVAVVQELEDEIEVVEGRDTHLYCGTGVVVVAVAAVVAVVVVGAVAVVVAVVAAVALDCWDILVVAFEELHRLADTEVVEDPLVAAVIVVDSAESVGVATVVILELMGEHTSFCLIRSCR